MQVEFVGDGERLPAGEGLAVRARANGTPFTCLVSGAALAEAARAPAGGPHRNRAFREHRGWFLAALNAKLDGLSVPPAEVEIGPDDLRADRRTAVPRRDGREPSRVERIPFVLSRLPLGRTGDRAAMIERIEGGTDPGRASNPSPPETEPPIGVEAERNGRP